MPEETYTFYLSQIDEDFNLGDDFDKRLIEETETANSLVVSVAAETTNVNYAYTPADLMLANSWKTGTITVKVNVLSINNAQYWLSLVRIDDTGTIVEESAFTDTSTTTGVQTFTFSDVSWTNPSAGDRFGVAYYTEGTHGKQSGSLEWQTGTTDTEVTTPFPTVLGGASECIIGARVETSALRGYKFEIERKKDDGVWETVDTIDRWQTIDDLHEYFDSHTFEFNSEYFYRLRELTEDTDWSNENSYVWDLEEEDPIISGGSTTHLIANTEEGTEKKVELYGEIHTTITATSLQKKQITVGSIVNITTVTEGQGSDTIIIGGGSETTIQLDSQSTSYKKILQGTEIKLQLEIEGESLVLIPIPQLTATDMTTHILLEWVVA